jgi:hypothetical protein
MSDKVPYSLLFSVKRKIKENLREIQKKYKLLANKKLHKLYSEKTGQGRKDRHFFIK